MKTQIISIISALIILGSCKKEQSDTEEVHPQIPTFYNIDSVTNEQISIKSSVVNMDSENIGELPVVKNNKTGKKRVKFHGLFIDTYRYFAATDERNPLVMKHYKKQGFKNITTKIGIENMTKDTIFYFPVSEKFDGYDNIRQLFNDTVEVSATVYSDKKLGSFILVDKISKQHK